MTCWSSIRRVCKTKMLHGQGSRSRHTGIRTKVAYVVLVAALMLCSEAGVSASPFGPIGS
jgi:hypothetical protein